MTIVFFRIINMMKQFTSNVTVTVITGNYYDEQLPSALNKVLHLLFLD